MARPLGLRVRGVRVRNPREVRRFLGVLAHLVDGSHEIDDIRLLDSPVLLLPLLETLLDDRYLRLDLLYYPRIDPSVDQDLASHVAEIPIQRRLRQIGTRDIVLQRIDELAVQQVVSQVSRSEAIEGLLELPSGLPDVLVALQVPVLPSPWAPEPERHIGVD